MANKSVHEMDALASIAEDDCLYVEAGDGSDFGKATLALLRDEIGALNQSQVDARVVAVASGAETTPVPIDTVVPDTTGALATQAPSANNELPYRYIPFAQGVIDEAVVWWQAPERWDAGTISIELIWLDTSGTSAKQVRWATRAIAYSDGDDLTATTGSFVAANFATTGDAKDKNSATLGPVTVANSPAKGDLIGIEAVRNGAHGDDNLLSDARLIGVVVHWNSDTTTDD